MVAVGDGAGLPQAVQPGPAGRDRRGTGRHPRRRPRADRHRGRRERRGRAGAAALDQARRGPRGRRTGGRHREPLVRPRLGLRRRRPEAVRRPGQAPRHPAGAGRLRHRRRAPRLPGRAGPLRPLPRRRRQAARAEAVRRHRAGGGGAHRGRPRRRGLRLLGLRDHAGRSRGPAAGRLLRPCRRRPALPRRLARGARGRARPGGGAGAGRRAAPVRRIPLRQARGARSRPIGRDRTCRFRSCAGRSDRSIDSPVGGPRAACPPRPCLDETRAQSDHRTITRGRGAVAARRRVGAVRQRLGACDTGQRAQGAVGPGQDRRPPAARGGRAGRRGGAAPLAPPPPAAAHPLAGRRRVASRQPSAEAADVALDTQAARAGGHRPGRRGGPGPALTRPRLVLDIRLIRRGRG
ncbi:putative Uncharacterized 50.6 kDa protein in the 5\\'region of gyrA and gyrB [Actinacidiphila cocklensis]|uniref:Uncharacterized 50.6 kDa protein in the 5\'region of gyrA and gyrB n=1 Tax=Actinacidiphila cocklensis TaxID=887465 RepID=A0A9W4GPS2_9ACTN|nr:putative Uncharacterized 50.6 kDa protein in the 5\\'region of gyrA and gyrB [Actinacidiphila cocklensis]